MTTQPLTTEERELLQTIYYSRRKFFLSVFIPLFLLAGITSLRIDYGKRHTATHRWTKKDNGDGLVTRNQMMLIGFLFLESMVCLAGINIYRKRILRYKKDISDNVKEMVPYEVIRKSHFEQTGQYFISFDDPAYMHHEVDEEFYNNINEGDIAYVARAPISKHVFEMNGRFTII